MLTGDQPVTHDISLQGPNIFVGGLWLAALRAMQEMTGRSGARSEAAEFGRRFRAASGNYDGRMARLAESLSIPDGDSLRVSLAPTYKIPKSSFRRKYADHVLCYPILTSCLVVGLGGRNGVPRHQTAGPGTPPRAVVADGYRDHAAPVV